MQLIQLVTHFTCPSIPLPTSLIGTRCCLNGTFQFDPGRFVNRLLCHSNAQMLWRISAQLLIFMHSLSTLPKDLHVKLKLPACISRQIALSYLSIRVLWHIVVHTYPPNCQPTRKDGQMRPSRRTKLSWCTALRSPEIAWSNAVQSVRPTWQLFFAPNPASKVLLLT